MADTNPSILSRLQAALAGRYDVRAEVGEGGMATVYVAEDVRHGRIVAIKVMKPELGGSLGADRFLREIQVAAHLNHPHILALLDSGRADDLLYYVMPWVEGESLQATIRRTGQIGLEDALRITREIADGLGYAHDRGLVHRDIKPANILFSSGHAVLTDFGIARALDQSGDNRLTRTGTLAGTPAYMSPEQWTGSDLLDARSDQYSLACVLYEMLVGEPPFTGPPALVMARHTQAPIPSVRLARGNVPEVVEAVVARALSKVPQDRFASVRDFAAGLAVGSGTTPVAATTPAAKAAPGASAPTRKWAGAWKVAAPALLVVALAVAGVQVLRPDPVAAGPPRLVVLPFDNLGRSEDAYFADGMTDELTNRLAEVGSLAVIARTSAVQYRGTAKTVSQIGDELDVRYVIEGTVRWGRRGGGQDSIKVGAALIRVEDGVRVWSDEYDRGIASVFEVQADVAEQVTRALDLVLLEPERRRLAAQPTDNIEAYDTYLRGNSSYERSWSQADVQGAVVLYEEAVELDPKFALAWAKLGRAHSWMHQLRYDETEDRLVAAKQAVDRALALDAGEPEAHIALGLYYYWGRGDYERAVAAIEKARELQPSNAETFLQIGNVRRRQGQFEDAIENYRRSAELDPRYHRPWFNLGETLLFTRNYAEAGPPLDRVTELAPEFMEGYLQRARLAVSAHGDVETARRILQTAETRIPPSAWGSAMINLLRVVRHPDVQPYLDRMPSSAGFGLDTTSYHLLRATLLTQLGRTAEATAQYDSARILLERLRDDKPGLAWVHGRLGHAYAGLGRAGEALRAAHRAIELMPLDRDALEGTDWLITLATVQTLIGRYDDAIATFEKIVAVPSGISVRLLQLDPQLAELRRFPRFQAITESRLRVQLAEIDTTPPLTLPGEL